MKDGDNPIKPADPPAPVAESSKRQLGRLEIAFWLLAFVLGFFHAWANHHYLINADAMSYLDIAEAYLRRDWSNAVNAYWNPLYSWLIALGLLIARPSPYWKFAVLHMVNFAIYLFALGCFAYLAHELIRCRRSRRDDVFAARPATLPDWALIAIGYALFIWSSLFLITVLSESPDMLVAAFMYLASGILLRIRRRPFRWLPFTLLGIVLGFGYLAKSVMFPLALVFIFFSIPAAGSLRRALPRVAVTVVLFLLVAGAWVIAISTSKGRLTIGESGRLNYFWSTNRLPFFHWQGEEPGTGQPRHPTRKIFDTPPAYEFGEPVGGTYPVWYDPAYWHEGSVNHLDLRHQSRLSLEAAKRYYELFHNWGIQYGLIVGLLCLYVMGGGPRLLLNNLLQEWSLIIPAMAGIGLYGLVNVQGRYVAPFIVLLWLALFSAVRLQHTPESERISRVTAIVLVGLMVFTTVASSSREAVLTVRQLVAGEDPSAHEQWEVAEGLRELGVGPSDKVAFIGDSFRGFWAHLLGSRIVAEIRRDRVASFWEADLARRREVIEAFRRTGVRAIVAENTPAGGDLSGWRRIRNTSYYAYLFTG